MSIVVPLPAQGGQTLSDYVFLLRRLLHDPNARMYPQQDLITYINIARRDIARITACLRILNQNVPMIQGQEVYDSQTVLPYGSKVVNILGVSVKFGNFDYKLGDIPWQRLNVWLRTWNTYQSLPQYFARYGQTQVYIGPVPNQNYQSFWDVCVIPDDLVDDTSPEQLFVQYQEAIPFYAAYYAKQYEQSFNEADRFKVQYVQILRKLMNTHNRRMFENPYGAP